VKETFFILIIIITSASLKGQHQGLSETTSRIRTFGIKTGFVQQKEKNIHPLVFNGINYRFNYSLLRQRENISVFNATLGNNHLKTYIEKGFQSMSGEIELEYDYLFKVFRNSK
jgi:hypothetical protein